MTMIRLIATLSLFFVSAVAAAMPGLSDDIDVDESIPTPAEVLGFEPGEWHPRHDQLVSYYRALAEASDRVHLEQIGQTHGNRPLLFLTFSRPDRIENLDEIRSARRDASRAGEGPPVAWLGYSVHGNEASGASAAMVTAWYLAAGQTEQVERWLDEMVIVMEPVINPDGLDRFAHWVNMHRGRHPSEDSRDREHNETWPSGRTNYYWFDLNRDWMPQVHPESQARLAQYHAWRPHVVTDHHEMGSDSSFFFQPGVPERNNPLTPERTFELTGAIADYHGEFLDEAGELYYTRESYDDFYVGKGSTYPDITGGVGILFEQGSTRGHVQDTDYGKREFADGVANQVVTSLSTLAATADLGDDLIDHQSEFFASAGDEAGSDRRAGWVLGDDGDPARAVALIDLLLRHDIAVHPAEDEVEIDGDTYRTGSAWIIPADQDHYRLLKSVLEPVTELPMETFYDVSTWPLGMAHDLPVTSMRRLPSYGDRLDAPPATDYPEPPADALAWLIPWDQYRADAVLAALLAEDFRVQTLTEPATFATPRGERELTRGSLIVHSGTQPDSAGNVGERLANLAREHAVEVLAAERGLSVSGVDLGSPSAPVIEPVKPVILTGSGLSPYHPGYIWHWFDTRLGQPITQLEWTDVSSSALADYTHLILPEGRYGQLADQIADPVTEFVRNGGVVLALRSASEWIEGLEDLEWDLIEDEDEDEESDNGEKAPERRAYADYRDDAARYVIGGAALRIDLDTTHPLGYGYNDEEVVVFRRGRHVLKPVDNHYASAAVYADEPLASGYLSDDNRERLAGTPAISASRHGAGTVVRMADDMVFRGYWRGGEKLLANALFFSRLIGNTKLPSDD